MYVEYNMKDKNSTCYYKMKQIRPINRDLIY